MDKKQLIMNNIEEFVNKTHTELFAFDTRLSVVQDDINLNENNRVWINSQDRKYLFYVKNNIITDVFDITEDNERIYKHDYIN